MSAYIEIVILDNLLIDYMLLRATALFFLPAAKKWRIWVGAAVGAAYAVIAPMKGYTFLLHPVAKIVVAFLLVLLAFGLGDVRSYAKKAAVFWLLSLAAGGVVSGLAYLFGDVSATSGMLAISGPPLWLLLLIAFVALKVYERFFHSFRRKSAQSQGYAKIDFDFEGTVLCLEGFIDTGNAAYDPISGLPAIIVSQRALEERLQIELDDERIERIASNLYIPYQGVGETGMLKGYIPESVRIHSMQGDKETLVKAAVAFTERLEGCDALIPPSLTISF